MSSLLLARGIASLGALTALAASIQHGRKPFLYTACSQTIPPLDRFSSFCPAASWSQFFRHSSCIHLLAFQPRLHVHTSCDRILTNEVTLISMSTHVAPSAATIAPRSIPRRYVYTSVHDGLRCLQPMWVQCIGFTRQLSATYCAHLVLISNFLFPQCAFQLPASIWFHWYVGFPPLASPQLLAFMPFQYPNFSCAPVPLSNFLHAFGFNISASPVSQQLLALIWFQYLIFPPVPLIKLL